jgi:hypothetical protein
MSKWLFAKRLISLGLEADYYQTRLSKKMALSPNEIDVISKKLYTESCDISVGG